MRSKKIKSTESKSQEIEDIVLQGHMKEAMAWLDLFFLKKFGKKAMLELLIYQDRGAFRIMNHSDKTLLFRLIERRAL